MKRFLGLVGLGLAATVFLFTALPSLDGRLETRNADRNDNAKQEFSVGALGRIEPHTEVLSVNAPSALEPAVVETLHVKVGDRVDAGQTLATLDSHRRELADVELAKSGVLMAEASLARVLAGAKTGDIAAQEAMVERSRSRVALAEKQLTRARRLSQNNALPEDELETRESELEVQQRELRHHEAALAALREVRVEDVAYAEAELARARAALLRAEADVDVSLIRSPIAGEVLRIHTRTGERMSSQGLLDLGDTHTMHVVAEVHEADIPKVRVGQPAEILLRNLDQRLHGRVVELGRIIGRKDVLSNDPVDDTDARVVEVRIQLNDADGALVKGLSFAKVEVRIDTAQEPAR
jgi:HlyD family secretion protein